jgi:hypothetical protein
LQEGAKGVSSLKQKGQAGRIYMIFGGNPPKPPELFILGELLLEDRK